MRNLTAAETVAAVRAAYPDIRKCRPLHGRYYGYCVGGAFQAFAGHADRPRHTSRTGLGESLIVVGVPLDKAYRYAEKIICRNDEGKFPAAWAALQEALESAEVVEA